MNGKNDSIVDRVVERIKKQPLGDLITEDDLHDIVKEAIPRAFFADRVTRDGYGREGRQPPVIVETMKEMLRPAVEKAVADWLVVNAEIVVDFWKRVMHDGVVTYVQDAMNERASRSIHDTLSRFVGEINEDRRRAGLPMIGLPVVR